MLNVSPYRCVGRRPIEYLPNLDQAAFEEMFRRKHPAFASALHFERDGACTALGRLLREHNEFETDAHGGRGHSYRKAQRATTARLIGIKTLLQLVAGAAELNMIPRDTRLLDVLGGDGLVTRALRVLAPDLPTIPILTSDMAGHMVAEALSQGLPAMRQAADFLFLRERAFDGVLIAYGSHHVAERDRASMCAEAFRVLRPGGRIVLHDFEEGSPVVRWFEQIVNRHTVAGHDYRHFTRTELRGLLKGAGFADIEVMEMYDPIRLRGASESRATDALLRYLISMYGLRFEPDGPTEVLDWLVRNMRYGHRPDHVEGWRSELSILPTADGVVAELPRLALVATAVRPDSGGD